MTEHLPRVAHFYIQAYSNESNDEWNSVQLCFLSHMQCLICGEHRGIYSPTSQIGTGVYLTGSGVVSSFLCYLPLLRMRIGLTPCMYIMSIHKINIR